MTATPFDWRRAYADKLVDADEAARYVQSGNVVLVTRHPSPRHLLNALAARRDELSSVVIRGVSPAFDPGWFQPGWQDSFLPIPETFLGPVARPALDERRIDYLPSPFSLLIKPLRERPTESRGLDVLLTVVSPPDRNGFCSFGSDLWGKRQSAKYARTVIAQVNESAIRTYGQNYIHVSEIDHLVDYTPPVLSSEETDSLIGQAGDEEAKSELRNIAGAIPKERLAEVLPMLVVRRADQIREFGRARGLDRPAEDVRRIAEHLSEIIRDGDTIQIGIGTPSAYMPQLGVFDSKKDLGWHSEMGAPGVIDLIRKGVITGNRKTINRGKAIFTGMDGCKADEIAWAADNPLIELHDSIQVLNISRTISAHENMTSINNALSIDLTGQINSETVFGSRLYNGTGGQPEFHMGSVMSQGGRAITLLRSRAVGGAVSRIVANHDEGAVITIPRTFADIVITEFGVARLLGKSIRERARELINIAHPDFRPDLKSAAGRMFWP